MFRLFTWPQTSPPVADRSCFSLFARSQSGMKFPLLSVQVRFAEVASRRPGALNRGISVRPVYATYWPIEPLTAVLPLPNRSYATPMRGFQFFQFGTLLTWSKTLPFGPSVGSRKRLVRPSGTRTLFRSLL